VAKFRVFAPRLDVMGVYVLSRSAANAAVAVTLQYGFAPLARAGVECALFLFWQAHGSVSTGAGTVLAPEVARVKGLSALAAVKGRFCAFGASQLAATLHRAGLLCEPIILFEDYPADSACAEPTRWAVA